MRWLASIPLLSALLGCTGKTPSPSAASYPGSFRIEETASSSEADGTKKVWLATAVRGEKSALFRIELLLKPLEGEFNFAFTKGAIVREEGSDGSWFLTELSQVLEAQGVPENADSIDRIEFDAAILGTSLSRQAGPDQFAGSFTSTPPGGWIAAKVFVADGEGEFFLNLNPADGQGEISLKDQEYGDIVVRELAKILLPKSGA